LSLKIAGAEDSLKKLKTLAAELDEIRRRLRDAETESADCDQQIVRILDLPSSNRVNEIQISAGLEAREKSRNSIKITLQDEENTSAIWLRTLHDLRQELRFQRHRRQSQELEQSLVVGLEPARAAFADFEKLLITTQSIREKLQTEFNNTLDQTLPEIGNMMTDVYRRLTQQVSFERVYVERGSSESYPRTLTVRVSSERAPELRCDPDDVLNGQAINALQLVPYFVFSQFQSETLELDLLIVDDPSQSFDTSRVKLLMQELATAASHAQLIIATHEEDRFRSEISNCFDKQDYIILHITAFDPDKGPSIEVS
jgi:hypothetical protein